MDKGGKRKKQRMTAEESDHDVEMGSEKGDEEESATPEAEKDLNNQDVEMEEDNDKGKLSYFFVYLIN